MSKIGDAYDALCELRAMLDIFHYATAGAGMMKEHEDAFGLISNELTAKCDRASDLINEHFAEERRARS